MFSRNKSFIFILLCIVGLVLYLIYKSANTSHKNSILTSNPQEQWLVKYPQLGTIESQESAILKQELAKPVAESLVSLSGTITNPLGVRDDILDFIIKTIPKSNTLAMRAAIKLAQNEQIIHYNNITQEAALELSNQGDLIMACLIRFLPRQGQGINFISGLNSLMINTKKRKSYILSIDRKYFGWKIFGTNLSDAEENVLCDKGEF